MAFAYPLNFKDTRWRVIDGDYYVSHMGSDLSGNGSPTRPFRRIQQALEVATNGARIVVGTGHYTEALNGLAKSCRLIADGTVVMKGTSGENAFSNMGISATITGFGVRGYAASVNGVVGELISCFIESPLTAFRGTVRDCVLHMISIAGVAPVRLINCTLIGASSASTTAFTRLENCHIGSATTLQLSTPALTYFDYCNQEPGSTVQINGNPFSTPAQVTGTYPSFQVHGTGVAPQFNRPDIGNFTLAGTSPLKFAGRAGKPIGALGEAVAVGMQQILLGGSLSGVTLNANSFFELPPGFTEGTILTPVIDLGAVRPVRTIRLYAEQVFYEAIDKIVSVENDGRLPGAITVEMRYADDQARIATSAFRSMIWDKIPSLDAAMRGNGSLGFNVRGAGFITTQYVQFRIVLRNVADLVLLAQEDNSLLLQEDERQIQV
jgi:hypothetical protein